MGQPPAITPIGSLVAQHNTTQVKTQFVTGLDRVLSTRGCCVNRKCMSMGFYMKTFIIFNTESVIELKFIIFTLK